jgi:L-idonate 5-dehydrogenase
LASAGFVDKGAQWVQILRRVGETPVALLITVLLGMYLLGYKQNKDKTLVETVVDSALGPVCSIILITGAGGMFGAVLRASGIGDAALAEPVAVLKRAGAAEIIAVDMFDRPLEIAAAAGATTTLKADDVEAIAAIEADVVIEASGNHRGLASAIRGAVRGEQPALISLAITRELELVGSFRFNDEIDEVLAALADGSLDLSAVITREFDVADALEAFGVAKNSAESGKVLLRFAPVG